MSQQLPSSAVAQVKTLDGTLLRLTPLSFADELADGDFVAPGDVLVTAAASRAVIALPGGGNLTMTGNSRAALHPPSDIGEAPRLVVLSGVFVLDAAEAGGNAPVQVESAAAEMFVRGATVAVSYELASGFRAVLVGNAGGADADVQVRTGGGTHTLDAAHPAVAVPHWSDAPQVLSAPAAEILPDWLPGTALSETPAATPPETSPAIASDPGVRADLPRGSLFAAEPQPPDAETTDGALVDDDTPTFMTGAGMPEAGDFAFLAAPASGRGLADHADLAPILVAPAQHAAMTAMPAVQPTLAADRRTDMFQASDHGLDALLGLQAPTLFEPPSPPAPPSPPGPPQLGGWEPSGRIWEFSGSAVFSSGDREWPWIPDEPLRLIRPVEGETMALLAPNGAWPYQLEHFLDLPDRTLRTLVDGVEAYDGSALRSIMTLKAGQTLVFDTLFDALASLPLNDFAAFTVSDGTHGEAFVLSSVAATGSLGATPWQSFEYTVGADGRYTIGFAVINDALPETRSRLYVDNLRDHLETNGLALIGERDDVFGGRFAQYEPSAPEPELEPGDGTLINSFETPIGFSDGVGRVDIAPKFVEPDGSGATYNPTDGEGMAVLHAYGASRPAIERLLGLQPAPGSSVALPFDVDGSAPAFGAATKLSLLVVAGDQLSFDWLFDAGDALPDNDFAVFTVGAPDGSTVFKLADVRSIGGAGASGWKTSVYTAAADADLTVGFAVVNDRIAGYYSDTENSRLLIDNVRLNRDFADGYQTVDLAEPGTLTTLPVG